MEPFSQPQLDETGAKSYLGSPGRRGHLSANGAGTASSAYDSMATPVQGQGAVEVADTAASRQRSSSPWHFQLNAQAANRLRSGESGLSTPVTARAYSRAASGTRTLAQQTAPSRTSYESALLAAVRRQIEAFEEKVNGRLDRLQQTGDRLREAALSRLEEKMNNSEGLIPKLDRRLAELSGNYKGLSDEMQSQIRKTDMLDDRLWEWRHQMEEEFRQKFLEFEQNVQKVSSGMRVISGSLEDEQKKQKLRLQRLETELQDKLLQHEETRETILNFHSRLDAVEERREDFSALAPLQRGGFSGSADEHTNAQLLNLFERRLEDVSSKADRTSQDVHDVHERIAAHEEQLRALRTLFDSREEHMRQLGERVDRGDWESKIDQLRQATHSEEKQRIELQEKVQLLLRRVDFQEQAQEELRGVLRNSRDEAMDALTVRSDHHYEDTASAAASALALQDVQTRMALIEARVSTLSADAITTKELAPKVAEQERAIRELRTGSNLSDRLARLEDEARHLSSVMLGSQTAAAASATKQELDDVLNTVVLATSDVAKSKQDISVVQSELDKSNIAIRQLMDDVTALREDFLKRSPADPTSPARSRTLEESPLRSPRTELVTIRDPAAAETAARMAKLEQEVARLVTAKSGDAPGALQLPTKKELDDVVNTLVLATSDVAKVKQEIVHVQAEVDKTNAAVRQTWQDLSSLQSDVEKRQYEVKKELSELRMVTEKNVRDGVDVDIEKTQTAIRATWQDVKSLHADVERKTASLQQEIQALKGFTEKTIKHEIEVESEKTQTAIKLTWQDVKSLQEELEKKSGSLQQELQSLKSSTESLVKQEVEAEVEKMNTAIRQTWQDFKTLQAEMERKSGGLLQEITHLSEGASRSIRQEVEAELEKSNIAIRSLIQDVSGLKQARSGESGAASPNIQASLVSAGSADVDGLRLELLEVRQLSEKAQEQSALASRQIADELSRLSGVAANGSTAAVDVLTELESIRGDLLVLKEKGMGSDVSQVQEELRQEIRDALLNFYARLEAIEGTRGSEGSESPVTRRHINQTADELRREMRQLAEPAVPRGADLAGSVEVLREEVRRLLDLSDELRSKVQHLESSSGGGGSGGAALFDLRQELDALKASEKSFRHEVERTTEHQIGKVRQELTDITGELRQDVGKLLDSEFRSKQDVAEFASRQQLDVARVEEAAARSERAALEVEVLRRDLSTLQQEVDAKLGGSARVSSEEVRRLDGEVAALKARVDGFSANGGGGADAAQLAELLKSVKRDEDAEKNAHQRLLERIDELFGRLAAVDAAVARIGHS